MDVIAENHPVSLAREELASLPLHEPPTGLLLRWYRPGDAPLWREIQRAADRYNEFPPELFQEQFGLDPVRLGERQVYLFTSAGDPVGTATAWFDADHSGRRWGRVHWVAVVPTWQGKGLGKVLMSAVCARLRELGHRRAYLTTSTARVPAINLYLSFGFVPEVLEAHDRALWRALEPHLRAPLPWGRMEGS